MDGIPNRNEKEIVVMVTGLGAVLIKELEKSGYSMKEVETTKNGVLKKALVIKDEKITPTFYYEEMINRFGLEGAVEAIKSMLEREAERGKPNVDLSIFSDKEKFLKRVEICIQKDTDEKIIQRPSCYEGINEYLTIKMQIGADGEYGFTKVTEQILKYVGIDAEEVWQQAEKNTFRAENIRINSMVDAISDLVDVPGSDDVRNKIFIVTNTGGLKGASQILNKNIIKGFLEMNGINPECAVFIPESIHEALIVINESVDEVTEMVEQSNRLLSPEEVLADKAYKLEL